MNLPNYFLADLPPGATLTTAMLTEACNTLKRNRQQYLANRSTESMIAFLSGLAANWLDPNFPFRKFALEQAPRETRFSKPTLENGLDAFFKQLTADNFRDLLEQDLGHIHRLERMTSSAPERSSNRASLAVTPEFLVHVTAGTLPIPAIQSICLGLLLRAAQFVKCASGASLLPRLFAHSIYDAEPKLGACVEIAQWGGGNVELETAVFSAADSVTATGTDQTLAAIRSLVPATTRFVGYGHRVSFAFVGANVLARSQQISQAAAKDVVAWDQQGCLSPHVIYVEEGGELSPMNFAADLAGQLERIEQSIPRGKLSVEESATIASRRSFYELRAAHSDETQIWRSKDSTAWTVVFEAEAQFQMSCLNRFVYVKSVPNLTEALKAADSIRGKVSTVGLAVSEKLEENHATELAKWGVTRVCRLGQMQNPPLLWRHDGRHPIETLVRWTDWEKANGGPYS